MISKNILVLPGDFVGPEVMSEALKVMDWFSSRGLIHFEIEKGLVGGSSYDKFGTPLTEEVINLANKSDAVLFGSIGGPKWHDVNYDLRPEKGLLNLRQSMGLFANLRPAIVFDALVDASSLKPDLVHGLDIMIVRELIGGIYFGEPRGIKKIKDNKRVGFNTQSYSTEEIVRIARVAYDLAAKRGNKVCSVDKANVMESGVLWREEVSKLRDEYYSNIELEHMFVDNCSMQLVKSPKQFDVILTDNLFGDILSDLAAMLTGSLGMLPSASLGSKSQDGKIPSLYEPVHGSAPDIAGKNIANPIAQILSLAMMLKYSLNHDKEADLIDDAVQLVLSENIRTIDIFEGVGNPVGTSEMGDAIISKLEIIAAN
ncbi:MAG: 3-isopropylmalate dehydrogenase [Pseudomonadota bacterium]|nr:3-isopropylmalate dehydrogenase [Pseudomonadota bacterium]